MSRARILEAALALMSERGVAGTSMRMLAGECGLNVATLYHHFPSKASLLDALLAERGYLHRLAEERPPSEVARAGPPAKRLERLVRWLWWAVQQEEDVWRLLIGEALRGEPAARRAASSLVDALDVALVEWLDKIVPELAGRQASVARLVRTLLFSLMVEQLALGSDEPRGRARVHDLVSAVSP